MWHHWTSPKKFLLKDSEGSRRGQVCHGAAGDKIANKREKQINAVTESGDAYNATYQIAAVTTPLNSISKICDRGNTVIFGSNGGVIVNNVSGKELLLSGRRCSTRSHLCKSNQLLILKWFLGNEER